MRRLLALLLALALCFALLGCQTEQSDKITTENTTKPQQTEPEETQPAQGSTATPLLYKVSDQQGNVIWLFGSIHIGREDFYPLPDYVMDAFQGSDALAVEMDILAYEEDQTQKEAAFAQMAYTDGTTIADHLPKETYDKAVAAMKELGLYHRKLEGYMPVVWWSGLQTALFEAAGGNAELGVDRHLLGLAKEQDMPVLEVESAQMQYTLLSGLSEKTQIYLLEQMLMMYEMPRAVNVSMRLMMRQWANGKEDSLSAYFGMQKDGTEENSEAYHEYTEALTGQRDVDMTQYAVEALQSGEEIFICVGAAHIVGEGAVAENLRELGYTVEIVR